MNMLADRAQLARILISFAFAALFVFSAVIASAQEENITYPIAELGNCKNKEQCKKYCDDLANVNQCVSFAEKNGLMDAEEATQARSFAKAGGKGPGGCTSKETCENFCENVKNIRECLAFAEEHDVMPKEELEEARQMARALEQGAELPGGCTSKAECESYCEDPTHMRQCLTFAKKAGFMDEKELAEAEKVAVYLEGGGKMPGGCKGERECKAYCESGDHMEECAAFAIKAGFMSEKDAEMFRKTGGKGPGGCRGKECENYCEDEAHQEECVAFALEHDLMSEEDKKRMQEGMAQGRKVFEDAPPEVQACIESAIGAEKYAKLKAGEGFMGRRLGEVIPKCFEQVMGGGREGGPFRGGSDASNCMRQVFGDDFEEKMRKGELDPGARDNEIRACMEKEMGAGYLRDDGRWERPQEGGPREGREGEGPRQMQFNERREGEMHREYKEMYRREYKERPEGVRAEMEARMRAEIEAQMRSGNFDPSRLPPDFRREGAFPPPESFNHPQEGAQMPPPEGTTSGMPRGEYVPPPIGSTPPPDGTQTTTTVAPTESHPAESGTVSPTPAPAPTEAPAPAPAPTETHREPVSVRNSFLANVLFIVASLFGAR